MKLAIGNDHSALAIKAEVIEHLKERGDVELVDVGTNSPESFDYAVSGYRVARLVADGEVDGGILICGTGIGMSIAANRHEKIRAALCTTELHASFTRRHNVANVLCLGARMTGEELAMAIVETFLHTDFEGGRHMRRIAKLAISNEAE